MPAISHVVLCALTELAVSIAVGLPLSRLLAPTRPGCVALAPALGWGVFNALALPLLTFAGFSRTTAGLLAGSTVLAGLALWLWPRRAAPRQYAATIPSWVVVPAAFGLVAKAACRRHPAQRGDVRPLKSGDRRRDRASGSAARQSIPRRRRAASRLLLSLAFQRGPAGAAGWCQRLGSRDRADLVHRLGIARPRDRSGRRFGQAVGGVVGAAACSCRFGAPALGPSRRRRRV